MPQSRATLQAGSSNGGQSELSGQVIDPSISLLGWVGCVGCDYRACNYTRLARGYGRIRRAKQKANAQLSLGNILHFCLLWFSGKSPLNLNLCCPSNVNQEWFPLVCFQMWTEHVVGEILKSERLSRHVTAPIGGVCLMCQACSFGHIGFLRRSFGLPFWKRALVIGFRFFAFQPAKRVLPVLRRAHSWLFHCGQYCPSSNWMEFHHVLNKCVRECWMH